MLFFLPACLIFPKADHYFPAYVGWEQLTWSTQILFIAIFKARLLFSALGILETILVESFNASFFPLIDEQPELKVIKISALIFYRLKMEHLLQRSL